MGDSSGSVKKSKKGKGLASNEHDCVSTEILSKREPSKADCKKSILKNMALYCEANGFPETLQKIKDLNIIEFEDINKEHAWDLSTFHRKLVDQNNLDSRSKFDGHMFVLCWVPSFAATDTLHRDHKSRNAWVAHGIWRADIDKDLPKLGDSKLDINLKSTYPELYSIMPRLSSRHWCRNDYKFYKYQWANHGNTIFDQPSKFFERVIALHSEYEPQLVRILGEFISKDKGFKAIDISKALETGLGFNVELRCKNHYLLEVNIWFDDDENPVSATNSFLLCYPDDIIFIPAAISNVTVFPDSDDD